MREFIVNRLLDTDTVKVRHVECRGTCRHRGDEECTGATHLVFPYRGLFMRHVGSDAVVADANQALIFNANEGYRVSHPVAGDDSSLDLVVADALLLELVPARLLKSSAPLALRLNHLRIDPRAQALVALLRHTLEHRSIEALEAESLSLTLISRVFGPRSSGESRVTRARRRLADRVKVLLASDLGRRWTLSEIAQEIGGSPVYLTQVFQQVERVPLYRYQLRLRLARALDLIARGEEISSLAHDLGFSSHSHFAAAFKQHYARSPSQFQADLGLRS